MTKKQKPDIGFIVKILTKEVKKWEEPIVTEWANRSKDPFLVLISCILSLRTKDETTALASKRLFSVAKTPKETVSLGSEKIEKLIYPVGFYRVKAANICLICKELIDTYDSVVPQDLDELLKLKGVGRKTANLVVTSGYKKPGICVDTHVHRISNRFGYIKTKNPTETEFALRGKLPKKYWIGYNGLLVSFGQHTCKPVSPFCSLCPVSIECKKIGVIKSR